MAGGRYATADSLSPLYERPAPGEDAPPALPRRLHLAVVTFLQTIMAVELVLLLLQRQWLSAFIVAGVIALPFLFRNLPVKIPLEIQFAVILFVFATLYLGEVNDYYERFWWWDMVLHGTSGVLLGLFGFLLVYIMNENAVVDLRMPPAFLSLFAFVFAVAIGGVWEIFEFGMDRLFETTMQKPVPSDPSGLTDTMRDLIVDTLGAGVTCLLGWRYLRRTQKGRVQNALRRFADRHPQLFGD